VNWARVLAQATETEHSIQWASGVELPSGHDREESPDFGQEWNHDPLQREQQNGGQIIWIAIAMPEFAQGSLNQCHSVQAITSAILPGITSRFGGLALWRFENENIRFLERRRFFLGSRGHPDAVLKLI
jgi:hypothetical protein